MKNKDLLYAVCSEIESILNRLVLVGGCATELLVTDPGAPAIRPTQDVDMVVEVLSHNDYYQLEKQLRQLGFSQSEDDQGFICRWTKGFKKLDLMPTDENILGFSNRWYPYAVKHAIKAKLRDIEFHHISAPIFVATKLEAFKLRGKGDYFSSHDLEDLISVIDGRETFLQELYEAPVAIRNFLAKEFKGLLEIESFEDSLPGHLPPDLGSQSRLDNLVLKLKRIRIIHK